MEQMKARTHIRPIILPALAFVLITCAFMGLQIAMYLRPVKYYIIVIYIYILHYYLL